MLKHAQTTDDIEDRLENARANTATDVSDGIAAAGNYRKGRFNYHGLRISIENPKGSTRSGTGEDGKRWSRQLKYDYGYIRGTMGADGDPLDVFIGDHPKSEMVYVLNQNQRNGDFDEHKVILGVLDAKQAKQTYLANYEAGWSRTGKIIAMTMPQFKDWATSDATEKPAGEVKQADIQTTLQPHQQRVVDRIQQDDQPGLVVAHGVGSGKSLASLAAQDALGMPASVVLPAALKANYQKEQLKHVTKPQPTNISSIEVAARTGETAGNPLLIVDEAHRLRSTGSKGTQALKKNIASKRLLLTGSPFYNHPSDISALVNLASGEETLPESREGFIDKYIADERIKPSFMDKYFHKLKPGVVAHMNPRRRKELSKILGKWVDYHPNNQTDFPAVTREDIDVEMTPKQLQVYDTILGKAPRWVAAKIRRGLPPSKQEARMLNTFMGDARQVSNSTRAFEQQSMAHEEPKIQRAFEELQKTLNSNPRAKAVVYSNWLNSGINPYKERLQAAGIPFGEFTGGVGKKERDDMVKQYNANKLRALLLSSAGGEGLDLKGTRLLQMLDPHWNNEKIKQIEGRGIRYKSHADLPEEERNINIQRFFATRPRTSVLERLGVGTPDMATDRYLAQMAANKARLNDEFRDLLIASSGGG